MNLDELLSRMAIELASLDSSSETMDTIAQYARVAVEGDEAGIMLVTGRRVETPAGTSALVDTAHQLQLRIGEGPCLEALAGGQHTVLVSNSLADDRWPQWGPAAADLGFHSVISSSLEARSRRIGSLNVYAARADAFSPHDAAVVQNLAVHASVAVAAAKERNELHQALSTRTLIGQAEGILMHAYDIGPEQAFAYLRRISQDQNVKLVEVAQSIVDSRANLGSGTDEKAVKPELA